MTTTTTITTDNVRKLLELAPVGALRDMCRKMGKASYYDPVTGGKPTSLHRDALTDTIIVQLEAADVTKRERKLAPAPMWIRCRAAMQTDAECRHQCTDDSLKMGVAVAPPTKVTAQIKRLITQRIRYYLHEYGDRLVYLDAGKVSGYYTNSGKGLVAGRYRNRYGKDPHFYTDMRVLYVDSSSDVTRIREREQFALDLEDHAHKTIARETKERTTVACFSGETGRRAQETGTTPGWGVIVYLAFKLKEEEEARDDK